MLVALQPTMVMKLAPAFPHSAEEVSPVKSLSDTMQVDSMEIGSP